MTFGEKVRELRQAKRLTLRELAAKVGVGFTYISKIENHKLEEGHAPSERLIHKLAAELNGNEEELLLLADKVPEMIRKRVCQRPEVFKALADLDDVDLDQVFQQIAAKPKKR
ncbi:MAG: helix-turn-helix transcriptional regulator [Planctomycetota bacterium]